MSSDVTSRPSLEIVCEKDVMISVTKKMAGKMQAGFYVVDDTYTSQVTDCDLFRDLIPRRLSVVGFKLNLLFVSENAG
jgi:hypothetical protein